MAGMRPLSKPEFLRLVAEVRLQRDRCWLYLGYYSGFRISEILSLQCGQVLLNSNAVVNVVNVERRSMKGKKTGRQVVLHLKAKEQLETWLRNLALTRPVVPSAWLFPSNRYSGRAISRQSAYRIIHRAALAAGLSGKIATHSLRKSYGQDLYESETSAIRGDLPAVQRALGHANIQSTTHYVNPDARRINQAILERE